LSRLSLVALLGFVPMNAAAQPEDDAKPAASPNPASDGQAPPASSLPAAKSEAPTLPASGVAAAAPAPPAADLEARLEALERENRELRDRMDEVEENQAWTEQRVDQVMPVKGRLTGYVDFGFFFVQGDGRGIRTDLGHEALPEYADVVPDSWVFLGDPLATAINSRGDAPDVSESRAITFDPIGNQGEASFILNAVGVQLFAGVGDSVTVNAAFDLVPRSRDMSNPDGDALGDYLDVKLGYAEYRLSLGPLNVALSAGKFDSVLGYEYRVQEAPTRISVTPSLVCRYTCGHPLGLKARLQALDDALTLNLALTNGSHFTESFNFADEVDANAGKTAAGRLSYALPLGAGLELGASGAYGSQDAQPETDVLQWHYGFDLHLEWADLNFTAEFVQGKAEGDDLPGEPACAGAPCLEYLGGYGLLGYRATGFLMPYVRADYREALHRSGASFVYYSRIGRGTGGLRFDLGTHVVVKAEYTRVLEFARLPEFDNDVFTSSLVARF
jgi:hypothetical protein